ncbi:MAG: polysaccharide lyase family protein [Polyangiales bacterium]
MGCDTGAELIFCTRRRVWRAGLFFVLVGLLGCSARARSGTDAGSGGTSSIARSGSGTGGGSGGSNASTGAAGSTGAQSSGGAGSGGAGGPGGASGAPGSSGTGGGSAMSAGTGGSPATIPLTPDCPMPTGDAVTLMQSGSSSVVSNGLVSLTIGNNGQLTQLSTKGKSLMHSGDSLYVSESGGGSYYSISASAHSVVQQSADTVELSFVDTSLGNHDMDWDLHYVVRRGVSGFYYFLIARTGTSGHPNPATLSELRTVQRFDPSILDHGYTGERHGALPTAAQNATFSSSTQIEDATYPLTVAPMTLAGATSQPGVVGQHYDEGPVFSKYDWGSYRTEDSVHGLYGNGFGVWLLSPSWEFYTGGPVKQELMVHHSNLILNMYHGGHYGSAISSPSPASWQKLYGPNLVYVNAGNDDGVIADALARATIERNQWPYCFMQSDLYPLAADRGAVTGTIAEAHGRSVEGAMVVLAQPGALLTQGYDYMFWAQADANGHFTIPEVRPGSYAIHVYATQGTIVADPSSGEIAGNATVVAGMNDLGALTWSPPFHANLLWSIGSSDQRSGEFRFDPNGPASIDNTAARTGRMYGPDATHGVWTVPPASATYVVGTSTEQTDWYFAQSVDGAWTVKFDLTSVPAAGAFLTLGIAGAARNPHLDVAINGHNVLSQGFDNDQSLYRSALQGGLFQMLTATVPAADLVTGTNTATFTLNTKGSAGAGVYYDIAKLESD